MKRQNHFTGSVFQFYIPEIKKYAFCKYFDFSHLSKFHGLLAQVFDKFSDSPDNSIEELKEADWLFGPRSMHNWPDLAKSGGWKAIGILKGAEDDIIPYFKGTSSFPYIVEDESAIGRWHVIKDTVNGDDCDYSAIRHLEMNTLTTKQGLEIRTGMEYCRANNIEVSTVYDLSNEVMQRIYWQMINIPIYNTIPKEIRRRVAK